MNELDRFMSKIVVAVDGCWLWTGSKVAGYGEMSVGSKAEGGKRRMLAHRWSYGHHVGPVPDGAELDHLCRTPACVNPAHLEPVTHAENMRRARGFRAKKTECKKGHPLVEGNTVPRHDKPWLVRCKTCLDDARIASAEKYRAANNAKSAAFREANREQVRKYARDYAKKRRAADPDAARLKLFAWRDANREEYNRQAREYQRRRRQEKRDAVPRTPE